MEGFCLAAGAVFQPGVSQILHAQNHLGNLVKMQVLTLKSWCGCISDQLPNDMKR